MISFFSCIFLLHLLDSIFLSRSLVLCLSTLLLLLNPSTCLFFFITISPSPSLGRSLSVLFFASLGDLSFSSILPFVNPFSLSPSNFFSYFSSVIFLFYISFLSLLLADSLSLLPSSSLCTPLNFYFTFFSLPQLSLLSVLPFFFFSIFRLILLFRTSCFVALPSLSHIFSSSSSFFPSLFLSTSPKISPSLSRSLSHSFLFLS